MNKRGITNLFVALMLSFSANSAFPETKIAPIQAEVGHPFTIIDTPQGRLVDGATAVFKLGGLEYVLPARTHRPFNTMHGRISTNMYAGQYRVFVRQLDGSEFEVGLITVLGPMAPPPTISPDIGAPDEAFTITDPLARIRAGDSAFFYREGTNPADGVSATNVMVSADGFTLTGNVPRASSILGAQSYVSVRPTVTADARFGDLAFFVTGGVGGAPETCNGFDDDRNGIVDDVPGIGLSCSFPGINNTGACRSAWACTGTNGGGPNGLTCFQTIGPTAEVCNGIDDDCDGTVDNNPTDVGGSCVTASGGAGMFVCAGGARICIGP